MIEVEKLEDGYRYWSQASDVIAHNQSGHMNSYSPDGKWLGLLEGGKWHLIHRSDPMTLLMETIHPRAWDRATNNVLQWTPDSRLLAIRRDVIQLDSPDSTTIQFIQLPKVTPPGNWDWMNWRSGDSTNQRLLHVWFGAGSNTDGSIGHFTLCIIDTETAQIINTYPFDDVVHRGTSTQPRWHHCFGCAEHLMISLSGWGKRSPLNPHYAFPKRVPATWRQLSDIGTKNVLVPETLPWSHVAYDNDRTFVVYGFDNRIQFANWLDGSLITEFVVPRERRAGYGHGCVAGTMIAYSLHDWQKGVDSEVWLWDTVLREHTKIADLSGLTRRDTASRARPQLAWDGSEVGWHELREEKGFVSFRTRKIEKPEPPKSKLRQQYELAAAELSKLGEMIPWNQM